MIMNYISAKMVSLEVFVEHLEWVCGMLTGTEVTVHVS